MSGSRSRKLITFLGTGDYQPAVYQWPGLGQAESTPFVCAALAHLWQPGHIHVLATSEARARNENLLRQALSDAGVPAPEFCDIRTGRRESGLWDQFNALIGLAGKKGGNTDETEVLLDITHGFRAQPFFAGAVIGLLQAIGRQPDRLHVVYAEYRGEQGVSRVWSLNLFVELTEWAQALRLFLQTGMAGPVLALSRRIRQRQATQARLDGSDFPTWHRLVEAIADFAADLSTVRIAGLVTGYQQNPRKKAGVVGSARRLLRAIAATRTEITRRLPPMALVLDELQAVIEPLTADRLYSDEGHAALQALARHYLQLERYPEAAVTVREAMVNLHAADGNGAEVNHPGFSDLARRQAEQAFAVSGNAARTIADLRNDIEHGGFRKQPLDARALTDRITQMVHDFAGAHWPSKEQMTPRQTSRTLLVSRHPGARDWIRQQKLAFNRQVEHLDPAEVNPGDIVIGTFPLHMAAALCTRGARVVFLSIDLPPEWRGRELDAHQLAQCNPRLEEFHVQKLGEFQAGATCR